MSAALAARLREIADAWLGEPEQIEVRAAASAPERAEAERDENQADLDACQCDRNGYYNQWKRAEAIADAARAYVAAVETPGPSNWTLAYQALARAMGTP